MKTFAFLLILSAATCATGRVVDTCPAQSQRPRRIVLITAWASCPNQEEDFQLRTILTHETRLLADQLRQLAVDADIATLENPDAEAIRAALRKDARPLWFIYSGHGRKEAERSVLCLKNGNLAEAEVIDSTPTSQPYATFIFNTCESAFVAINRANTVVMSAGPETVDNEPNNSHKHGETVLGNDLLVAVRAKLDADNNGIVDSRELFAALNVAQVATHPVQLKLQAQSWHPLPLFSLFPSVTRLPDDLGKRERDFRAGLASPAIDIPQAVWLIPEGLDGLAAMSMSIRRVTSLAEAETIARGSLATRVFQVVLADGSLTVQDMGLRETLWHRPLVDGSAPRLSDQDLTDFLNGYEDLDDGLRRRYLRPVSNAQQAQIRDAGFRPTACGEPVGQCFVRTSSPGASR
jgi:hypothetical protein